ncbi:hypothetical protein [Planctomicrobium sp. SH664]|uniref:hypothetical protein n=1 Tax=Planctomicrobium sp. SH664 TaxID=3448125 RepID=UPI003F5CAC0B
MSYKLQALGIGGILDQGLALFKNKFTTIMGIMLCTIFPVLAAQNLLAVSAAQRSVNIDDPALGGTVAIQTVSPETQILNLIFIVVNIFIANPLAQAATVTVASREYLGQRTSLGQALKAGLGLIPAVLGTSILYGLIIMGGFILLIIPGILFALWYCMYVYPVVIERVSGMDALRRSKQILAGQYGTLIGLGFILGLAGGIAGGLGGIIPQPHLRAIGVSVIQAVFVGLTAACQVVFYFSCRCKNENFDLVRLAEAVGAAEAAQDDEDDDFARARV